MEEDHGYWGRPEDMGAAGLRRPAFVINATHPGTDLAAQAAAALAAVSKARGIQPYLCIASTENATAPCTGCFAPLVTACISFLAAVSLNGACRALPMVPAPGRRCSWRRTPDMRRALWATHGSCTALPRSTAAPLPPACRQWLLYTRPRSAACPHELLTQVLQLLLQERVICHFLRHATA